jgi:hypothetical protein
LDGRDEMRTFLEKNSQGRPEWRSEDNIEMGVKKADFEDRL